MQRRCRVLDDFAAHGFDRSLHSITIFLIIRVLPSSGDIIHTAVFDAYQSFGGVIRSSDAVTERKRFPIQKLGIVISHELLQILRLDGFSDCGDQLLTKHFFDVRQGLLMLLSQSVHLNAHHHDGCLLRRNQLGELLRGERVSYLGLGLLDGTNLFVQQLVHVARRQQAGFGILTRTCGGGGLRCDFDDAIVRNIRNACC
mmetsp:Transcript_12322/g.35735  ORF Transcript_12322/g.35735 Transcript_12322/m.35735 type:complete len:200 (-) Transcript_12322:1007-1606(-)